MNGIFINYRGEDSQTAAALIDRELSARFGDEHVFLDSRSIPAGTDFADELLGRLRACSVLLVVIGPRWLTVTDRSGRRRIDDPHDWIRREIEEALASGLRVIPVLTDGATLPTKADLPGELAGLSRRQYVPLRHRYTAVDLTYLGDQIAGLEPGLVRPGRPAVLPRQLPAAPRLFTGRAEELASLTKAMDEAADAAGATVLISAIGGAGGIGKSWLALHWAHQQVQRFPDGQLFVNLRAYDPTAKPTQPAAAVRGFLDALGVAPAAIPVDLDAQVGLYRSMVADRRMLIVLDNASDSAQVIPLLPGNAPCTVLVTSRRRLTGLVLTDGARFLELDVLSEPEARELLAAHLGQDRLSAEPDAVVELLEYCAGWPLALGIVAARATAHPDFPLRVLADDLRDHTARLDGLDAGEIPHNLRAVFAGSYTALPAEAAALFGLLGLARGPDLGAAAAAALMGVPIPAVRRPLRELETAHLVAQPVPGRYRMHDLLRLYAADVAGQQPEGATEAALRRLVDFYLHTAHDADRLLEPRRPQIELSPLPPGCHPDRLPDQAAGLAWFESEHQCLLATQQLAADHGWHRAGWQLAWVLQSFFHRRGHLHDRLAAWQAALAAATLEGDPQATLRAHRILGDAYANVDRHEDAHRHLGSALDLARHLGDLPAQAHTQRALALAWERRGDDQRALEHATSALRLFQEHDEPLWQADLLNAVGWYSARLGRYQEAGTHCRAALELFRRLGDPEGEAGTLHSLGYLAHRTGQHEQAMEHYRQALVLLRDRGNAAFEATTLDHLGQALSALGRHDQAREAWRRAVALYREQHRVADGRRVQQQLDALPL